MALGPTSEVHPGDRKVVWSLCVAALHVPGMTADVVSTCNNVLPPRALKTNGPFPSRVLTNEARTDGVLERLSTPQ